MKKRKGRPTSVHLPLTHALAYIVFSLPLVSGGGYVLMKHYLRHHMKTSAVSELTKEQTITSIIQTGPQKEALNTQILAEIIGLSADYPTKKAEFDVEKGERCLMEFPLISKAQVKVLPTNTVYIDYTVRKPLALLYDFENTLVDKEGFPFPFSPYFSPKNLPEIYLGLEPFGVISSDLDKPVVQWQSSIKGRYFDLAVHILSLVTEPAIDHQFNVKRIDVSRAFAESYGQREIVVTAEDSIFLEKQGRQVQWLCPRVLRLSTKNYPQELANYLLLRRQLLQEEEGQLPKELPQEAVVQLKEKIIDFRIPQLAYIE